MSKYSQLRSHLNSRIQGLRADGLYRSLPEVNALVDLCSNDYLGLIRDPIGYESEATETIRRGVPSGSSGSRLISGNSLLCEQVEREIAAFHGAASALIFSSGYLANLALIPTLVRRHDTVIYDRLIHASLRDGIRLSGARSFSFAHNDIGDLQRKLAQASGAVLIVVEAIYSMEGDRAPLKEIVEIAQVAGAEIVVDEAHSTGIDGQNGQGLVSALGLEHRVFARTVTFGKALGCHGAAIISDGCVRENLINRARGFIYSTAISPGCLLDIQRAYRMLPFMNERRERLKILSLLLRKNLGILDNSTGICSPIHQIRIPGNHQVLEEAERLRQAGFGVVAIRSPSVPPGSERIRICLHSFNTEDDIVNFCEHLSRYQPENGVGVSLAGGT